MPNSKSWKVRLETLKQPSGKRQRALMKICVTVVELVLQNVQPKRFQVNLIQVWECVLPFMCRFHKQCQISRLSIRKIVPTIKKGNAKSARKFVRQGLSASIRRMNSLKYRLAQLLLPRGLISCNPQDFQNTAMANTRM